MKQLRQNAAHIGERGIIFLGIPADQIIKVTEFVSGLKDGSIKLPLNDLIMELTVNLAITKSYMEADKLKVEQLKIRIIGLGGKDVNHSNISSDMDVMRQVLEDIQNQNHIIQENISCL